MKKIFFFTAVFFHCRFFRRRLTFRAGDFFLTLILTSDRFYLIRISWVPYMTHTPPPPSHWLMKDLKKFSVLTFYVAVSLLDIVSTAVKPLGSGLRLSRRSRKNKVNEAIGGFLQNIPFQDLKEYFLQFCFSQKRFS